MVRKIDDMGSNSGRKGGTPVGGRTSGEALISTRRLVGGTIPDSYMFYKEEDGKDMGKKRLV